VQLSARISPMATRSHVPPIVLDVVVPGLDATAGIVLAIRRGDGANRDGVDGVGGSWGSETARASACP